mmetsp:Transcript_104022/g.335422  ORF Transcript_104022/g.335422 Transcript_104022/m.335422 type:complete len:242 (-) Transcript_104022:7-732(-)
MVGELAGAHHQHAWLRRHLPEREDDVATGRQELRDRRVAHLLHYLRHHLDVAGEERVHGQHRRVELEAELVAQGLGDDVQELHALLLHEALPFLEGVLCVVEHAHRKPAGDLVLEEVALEHLQALHVLLGQHAELRHGRSEPANEDGGHDEGQEENKDGVDTLAGVLRHDLVRATRELEEGPMEGRGVLKWHGRVLEVVHEDPRVRSVLGRDAVPHAGNHVPQSHDDEHHLDDTSHEHQLL